jgi:alkylation response protein AidB-like acyl-CoA dehydrogenase
MMKACKDDTGLWRRLTRILAGQRAEADAVRVDAALRVLHSSSLLDGCYIRKAVAEQHDAPRMFSILVALGRGDLSVARLYEGHVNALQLIARLGTPKQVDLVSECASSGGLLGVWGADHPTAPARITPLSDGFRLTGKKTFVSGAHRLAFALIAAKTADKKTQLILLPRSEYEERFDSSWWRPFGMQATDSFALDLDDIAIGSAELIGQPGDYETQPFFGAGAIRFVSAQLGGALAVWDATRDHLGATGRYENPHQAARLGQMVAELEGAFSSVENLYARAASAIQWESVPPCDNAHLRADAARVIVEGISERVIALAIRSVGCAGLMDDHPLSSAVRDLMVYLRQPAPDAALTRLGTHACSGSYRPVFDET